MLCQRKEKLTCLYLFTMMVEILDYTKNSFWTKKCFFKWSYVLIQFQRHRQWSRYPRKTLWSWRKESSLRLPAAPLMSTQISVSSGISPQQRWDCCRNWVEQQTVYSLCLCVGGAVNTRWHSTAHLGCWHLRSTLMNPRLHISCPAPMVINVPPRS